MKSIGRLTSCTEQAPCCSCEVELVTFSFLLHFKFDAGKKLFSSVRTQNVTFLYNKLKLIMVTKPVLQTSHLFNKLNIIKPPKNVSLINRNPQSPETKVMS